MTTPIFSELELQRTDNDFTIGLVNLPIKLKPDDKGILRPIKVYDQKKQREKYDVIPDLRYPFFELDTKEEKIFKRIMRAYEGLHLPVYVHRTMRGYHFISLIAIHKDCYAEWIKPLMKYNPECPMVTLRIKPNKWVNEKHIWYGGNIFNNNGSEMAISELETLKAWIERQAIGLISMKYYVVRYRMTGEAGNL